MMVSFYLMEVQMFDIGNSCHQFLRFTYETLHQCQFRIASDISNLLTASNTCTGKVLIARQFSRAELEENVLRNTSGQDALKNSSYRFQNPPGKKRI